MLDRDLDKAALRGEPSYVWRRGQERRLQMILDAAGDRLKGIVLENGCGVGIYLTRLATSSSKAIGLEYDFSRAQEAHLNNQLVVNAAGEYLPLPSGSFDLILSHEVLEHVQNDRACVEEMVRVMRPGGRMVVFVPNRGYPFETHGIYWRGRYHFGNIPLINYLPSNMRDRLAPHVRIYSARQLEKLFSGLPVKFLQRRIIFGAYDNIIVRWPRFGRWMRRFLQGMENTPARVLGLSHFWVVEKT
ncbi:MAG: class I SAM-dependent methyltransferase [Chloroflexota bacterium]|nr:MAG: class I SAM-dependent methyltransferase [Chloroflexota bacterium]